MVSLNEVFEVQLQNIYLQTKFFYKQVEKIQKNGFLCMRNLITKFAVLATFVELALVLLEIQSVT